MTLTRMIYLVVLIASFGCSVNESSVTRADGQSFGYKSIVVKTGGGVATLKMVLNDWDSIFKAILAYDSRNCVFDNLTIESINAVGEYDGPNEEVFWAGINADNSTIILIGTDEFCQKDESTSGPEWVVVKTSNSYSVVHVQYISETN